MFNFNIFHREKPNADGAAARRAAPRRGVASRLLSTTPYPLPTTHSRQRRGVLLLVVLSLLILFLMVGTAFVILAKQSEKAAKMSGRGAEKSAQAAARGDLLDEVVRQMLRDTKLQTSSLRGHSLLGDMYGNDGFKAAIANPAWPAAGGAMNVTGGQMLEFTLVDGTLTDFYGNAVDGAGNQLQLSPLDNAYSGQTLTFLSGPARNRSTRIVGYFARPGAGPGAPVIYTFRVMNVQLADGSIIANPNQLLSTIGPTQILVNGRPFNGTGAGFNPWADEGAPKLNAEEMVAGVGAGPLALMPNAAFLLPTATINLPSSSPTGPYFPPSTLGIFDYNGRGGADESYDAVDFQNMPLAYVPATTLIPSVMDETTTPPTPPSPPALSNSDPADNVPDGSMVIPSFHRPELLYYWNGQLSGALASNPMMLRKVLLRPNWKDHPSFTGSNPEFSVASSDGERLARMVYGPWDVDNDNDGIQDSIWIDFGAAVMTGPNGKLVKPLAAILCIDMDGRLNVNAHGTLDLAGVTDDTLSPLAAPGVTLASGVDPNAMPRGVGFGPAEISLAPALEEGGSGGFTDFRAVLRGEMFNIDGRQIYFPGRYGPDGDSNVKRAGFPGAPDALTRISKIGWPDVIGTQSSFVTPPDVRARYGLGVNDFGQPVYDEATRDADGWALLASPYEINLSRKTAAGVENADGMYANDAPFTVAELERVLRVFDPDASALPSRLAYLSGVIEPVVAQTGDLEDRLKITTDSLDLPAPNVALPHELHDMVSTDPQYARQPRSTAELIEIRVRAALFPGDETRKFPRPLNANDAATVRNIVRRLVAPELVRGERLNINRPLGNGIDDNGNGVIDEPGELTAAGAPTPTWVHPDFQAAALASFQNVPFPVMATDFIDETQPPLEVDHRQLLARHLYVLELTLAAGEDFGSAATAQADRELATRLAQWAVNTVDYRDADNIQTAFEFDVNPFDGWDVDGWLGDRSPGPDGRIGTGDDVTPSADNTQAYRGVVWGMERPELVISETGSWHDRRTDDTNLADTYPPEDQYDNSMDHSTEPDTDYDQLVRPRGALIVEVHNPWPGLPAAQADTHRKGAPDGSGPDLGVDLARTHNGQPNGNPVWRMAIYKRNGVPPEQAALWDPDDPDPRNRPPGKMDRAVYMAGPNATIPDDTLQPTDVTPSFFNSAINPVPPVRPGRFLVIAGADERSPGVYQMQLGDRKGSRNPANAANRNIRRIELDTNPAQPHAVKLVDANNATVRENTPTGTMSLEAPAEADVQAATTMGPAYQGDVNRSMTNVAIIDQAVDKPGDAPVRRRLTISEPAIGYPDKFRAATWSETAQEYRAQGAPMAIDIPLDGPIGGAAKLEQYLPRDQWPSYLRAPYVSVAGGDPVLTTIIDPNASNAADRTNLGASYSFIYLQRLANPLLPWNPEPGHRLHRSDEPVNPYLTVDSSSANLTVFNSRGNDSGEEEPEQLPPPNTPRAPGKPADTPRNLFASHERGYTAQVTAGAAAATTMPSLWNEELPSAERERPGRFNLQTKLAPSARRYYVGAGRLQLAASNDYWFNAIPLGSFGFLNRTFHDPAAAGDALKAKPRTPYEWLAWNNRPYASGNELMLVPRLRSSQILKQFSNGERAGDPPAEPPSPYGNATGALDAQGARVKDPQPAFAHLENFFFHPPENAGVEQPAPRGTAAHLYRLLEYVHAPSLFAGTETWLNPAYFKAPVNPAPPITNTTDPRLSLQAPFNTVSEFRDPGRVNVNTIMGDDVWRGLFHGRSEQNGSGDAKSHPGPNEYQFAASRRGYGDPNNASMTLEATMPTLFVNPFRSPDAGDLVPLTNMVRDGVDVTLLRRHFDGTDKPFFAAETDQPHRDHRRNAFHRYQPMTRLDSMITTRSNVYAVWVTIGYFEVEPAPTPGAFASANGVSGADADALYQRVYPDGYQLSKEDGIETGDIRRLRGFYILDRTIPAGFEPGADHNAEDAVRLRRRIE